MELLFLGTNAGMPIRDRNVSSIVLRFAHNGGSFFMFDCGEGTQHQLLKTSYKLAQLDRLFITHLHGDHLYGLPGLLSSRSSLGGMNTLHIYGPFGLRDYIETNLRITETHLNYEIQVVEIEEGIILETDDMIVEAAKLDHRIDCYGYRMMERDRPGELQAHKLIEMGIPPGPVYKQLKEGQDITLMDGRCIRSADVVGQPLSGRIITILGDTRPCANAVSLSRDADVLIHEATFSHELIEKANEYGHSTALQAAQIAHEAGVGKLLITHFSSRYTQEDLTRLEEEARSVFLHTDVATELNAYKLDMKRT